MPGFKIVNNSSEIILSNQWVPSTKFNSKDRLVDAKGKAVSSDYKGRQYRIIEKRERILSTPERIGRGFLGTLAVVCTLFLGLFSKSVRNLFIKPKENVRFGVLVPPSSNLPSQIAPSVSMPSALDSQRKVDPVKVKTDQVPFPVSSQKPKKSEEEQNISEKELQQGMSISEETVAKIQTCMKNVLQCKEEGGVKLYNSQGNHRVFALDTAPGLIFKMKASKNCHTLGKDDSMKARYQTMINAQTVIRTHQLGLLVIPHAKLFTVNSEGEEYEIIAEQRVDINAQESAQEQYFHDYADSLNETIRQLAVFICKTGYSDVEWRNNPILNNSLDENGNRKIALIDIEEMDGQTTGLFGGGFGRRGLVRCVSEEQGKIVETVAKQNSVSTSSFANAHARRKEELADGRKLREYYATKNIVTGDEPVQIDESTLDFSAYPEKTEKLKLFTLDLVKAINEKTSKSSSEESVKGRRYIYINTNKKPFQGMNNRLIDENISANSYKTDEEYYNATFLGHVVKKLADLGAIYKLVNRNGHGYFIQA